MENEYNIPQDPTIECKVLAELVGNPELIPVAIGGLSDECFTIRECKDIFATIVQMYEAHETIDFITLSQKVDRKFLYSKIIATDSYGTDMSVLAHCEALRSLELINWR